VEIALPGWGSYNKHKLPPHPYDLKTPAKSSCLVDNQRVEHSIVPE
jgi:hypothetical protein